MQYFLIRRLVGWVTFDVLTIGFLVGGGGEELYLINEYLTGHHAVGLLSRAKGIHTIKPLHFGGKHDGQNTYDNVFFNGGALWPLAGIRILWDGTTFNSANSRLEVAQLVAIQLLQTVTVAVGLELQN